MYDHEFVPGARVHVHDAPGYADFDATALRALSIAPDQETKVAVKDETGDIHVVPERCIQPPSEDDIC
jgi:hypothetical protein